MAENDLAEEVRALGARAISEMQAAHEARMQLDKALDALWEVAKLDGTASEIAKKAILQITGEESWETLTTLF